jgi:predicted dehydrogenase
MPEPKGEAFRVIHDSAPKNTYRGAVVGCGRMGSTIDDEHIGMPNYPWPWAHAPAMVEARGIDLVAASDSDPAKLEDFKRRWGTSALYTDFREMVEKERPDVVALTTRPDPRAEITIGLAEMGVKAIYATKPMCRTLAEADAMIEACAKHGTILSVACHLNWYSYYTKARQLIADGLIGPLKSVVCHSPASLSNIQSHSLALIRLFVGSPAKWVVGIIDSKEHAASDNDIPGSGTIVHENGVHTILNSRVENVPSSWSIEFIGETGRIISRHAHSQFEIQTPHPVTGGPTTTQLPGPWHPRSSMVDAIEGVCRSIEEGREEICPGEFGREALEIGIAIRESHRRGNVRVDLPLEDRSLRMGNP